jgi:hypothetical protein
MKMTRSDLKRLAADYPVGSPYGGPSSGRREDFIFGGGDTPPAPDTTAMAGATKEAAEIAAAQADRVLAESTRQYDRNMEVAKPVIDSQLETMRQTNAQGKDYYEYLVDQQRPVERALNTEAMAAGSEAKQKEAVDRAVADSQGSYTRALNQGLRQARRYGINPANVTSTSVQQAAQTAAAATGARDKEIALGTAKKMDVAGLYRGLPGASTGAYGVAINAGNSAVNNSMAPGAGMQAGTLAAANLATQGGQFKMQGAGQILNANQNTYQSQLQSNSASSAGLGNLLGMGLKFAMTPSTGGAGFAATSWY